jgi:hypothetical protein
MPSAKGGAVQVQSGADGLQAFWRRSVRLACGIAAAGAAVLLAATGEGRAALGFLLGSGVSLLRFRLRYRALADLSAVGPVVRSRLAGYALSAVPLAIAFAFPHVAAPWPTVAGLLVMNVSVLAAELTEPQRRTGGSDAAAEGGP